MGILVTPQRGKRLKMMRKDRLLMQVCERLHGCTKPVEAGMTGDTWRLRHLGQKKDIIPKRTADVFTAARDWLIELHTPLSRV